jgi:hypothetical protein
MAKPSIPDCVHGKLATRWFARRVNRPGPEDPQPEVIRRHLGGWPALDSVARTFGPTRLAAASVEENPIYRQTLSHLRRRSARLLDNGAVLFSITALATEPPVNTLKKSVFGGPTDTAVNGFYTVPCFTVCKPDGPGRHGHWRLTLFSAFVVIKSLFFKLTGSPETDCICQGKLDLCAASPGLTAVGVPDGNFAAKVVDTFELIASMLLPARAAISDSRAAQVLDAAIGLGVISGATCWHLFTPRSVAVVNTNGDQRFMLVRGVWVPCEPRLGTRRGVGLGWPARLTSR